MSIAIDEYKTEGLRFWTQKEIVQRENFKAAIVSELSQALSQINSAWTFHQTETPILTPYELFSNEYTSKEIFKTDWDKANTDFYLRAETTPGSYAYAKYLLNNGAKMPLCVWQVGKSFRKEANDGASAAKLRFNEFNQLEFQCIYKNTTKANYRDLVIDNLEKVVAKYTGKQSRVIESDRIPNYSKSTMDIEVLIDGNHFTGNWREMASCSIRTDFSDDTEVAEFAFGLDRIATFA